RETAVYVSDDSEAGFRNQHSVIRVQKHPAYIPLQYISDSCQRIEMYRKLAQVAERAALESLKGEMCDRFGALPASLELLLRVTELKLIAGEKNVTVIETKDDRLMLKRHNDYITLGDKFPRLTKMNPKSRLNEIKKMLLAL